MANKKEYDVSKYFLEMQAAHEKIIAEMKHDALAGDDTTYKQAKDFIDSQLDLVPNIRSIRSDDSSMFMGLVNRARNSILKDQDNLKVHNNDRKED